MRAEILASILSGALLCASCLRSVAVQGPQLASPGSDCRQSADCTSGLCLGQRCCLAASCGSGSCQATTCDDRGACAYPTVDCGPPSCDPATNQLSGSRCEQGACVVSAPAPCPGNLTCADAARCRTSCSDSSECVPGFFCSSGQCVVARTPPGTSCSGDGECASGICGVTGKGHCCVGACASGDPQGCGALDCDLQGACAYPPVGTPCVAATCVGHVLTEPASCDGAGTCAVPIPATVDCAPYTCAPNGACRTACGSSADCANGFCRRTDGLCYPGYWANTIQVDGTLGVDQAGCGAGLRGNACATIAFAASLARESGGLPATISVANPPNGKDWIGDPFPINLDEGIALSAPGLYFYDPGWSPEPTELFLVGNLSQAANPMPSIIEGSAGAPIHIGVDSLGNVTPVGTGILVREGALRLLAAELLVPEWDWLNSGVLVDTGGALTLGTDGLGSSGTVWIGAPDAGQGAIGIRCGTPSSSGLMTIDDQGSTASPSLWTQNLITGIHAPNCAVNLSAGPRFGLALNEAGGCDSRADQFCLFSGGAWSGAVRNAIFQCCTLGLTIAGDYTMDNDVFQFNGTGVSVGPDGSPTSAAPRFTNCSFHDNDIGIGTTGRVDLSGGGNQISCNRTGGLVVSQGVGSVVSAEHVAWDLWDPMAGHTEIWECVAPVRGTVWSCTCTGASTCPSDTLTTPPPGAPAVYYRDQPQPRPDDANGSQSPSACR